MTSGKKLLQRFAVEYFNAKPSRFGISRSVHQKAAAITTLIVDTNNLATGKLRFNRTIPHRVSENELRHAAAKALAGHATAEATVLLNALGATPPKSPPLSAPSDIVLGSVWHHGATYEEFWIGSIASVAHYADITENEREHLHMLSRKLSSEGAIVYAVAESKSAKQPERYSNVRATFLGLLIFQPILHPGIEQTVAAIRAANLSIVYASRNPEHVAQSFARVSCISPGPAIAYKWRRGHDLPLDKTLYAHLSAAARQQVIERYGKSALVVNGPLPYFWQQLSHLRK